MPKRVTASEAKNRFGAMVSWAVESQDDVIVESHGEPKAVIISFDAYQEVQQLRETAQRQAALARLRQLRDDVRARNQDLGPAEAETLADRFSREVAAEKAGDARQGE